MNAITRLAPRKLGAKINAILFLYFVFALAVILLTLNVAHQLEGGAAAINEAGKERMRTYGLAYYLHQSLDATQSPEVALDEVRRFMRDFEGTLYMLEVGDPERPLFLPRDERVQEKMHGLRQEWNTNVKPQINKLLAAHDDVERSRLMAAFDNSVRRYVPIINELVLMVERSNAHSTSLMYMFQNMLVVFSLLGTLLLAYLIRSLVIAPVETLRAGIERMAASDFGVRLPVVSQDEIGELATGFNRMADHLQDLYATLEQRVADKTRSVEEKNRELALLYEITAYLAEPATLEELCRGVLLKLCDLLGASGGVVRMTNSATRELEIIANHNMSNDFVRAEARLPLGTCLCGNVAAQGASIAQNLAQEPQSVVLLANCMRDGYAAMAAIPIRSKSQVFGMFTLFFREERILAGDELRLLEAIGQHLGVEIENLRLAVREKEMAVSEERNLLAQELHDSIAQSLAFLNIQAQMLQGSLRGGQMEIASAELARMREGIQESYDNVRELLVHFRIRVDHAELDDAIRSALEKFEGQTGIKTSFNKIGYRASSSAVSTIQVLHIIQEALSNVRKHAGATKVDVEMRGDGAPRISVRDNGKGFDLARVVEEGGSHVGIGIMRERAHRIGARLEIDAAPGRGTCVTLVLPQ
ncbi:type IV pili methyl-accepting chemotaxis transducer N-terminal domain-containing protein [Georgfuchsia toluolica]|nr:type IV pili methyl-accepting chemotaxis transducer N-terminal domain-containing protein [Georgfuchsia toluolica]